MPTLVVRKDQADLRGKIIAGQRQILDFMPLGQLRCWVGCHVSIFASGENKKRIRLAEGCCVGSIPLYFKFVAGEVAQILDRDKQPIGEGEQFKIAVECGLRDRDALLREACRHRCYSRTNLEARILQWKADIDDDIAAEPANDNAVQGDVAVAAALSAIDSATTALAEARRLLLIRKS